MRLKDVRVGMRVEAGKPGTEDYDTGEVLEIDPQGSAGHQVLVAWDTLAKVWCDAGLLRAEG